MAITVPEAKMVAADGAKEKQTVDSTGLQPDHRVLESRPGYLLDQARISEHTSQFRRELRLSDARSLLQYHLNAPTWERLDAFVDMLRIWNAGVNLVATSTLEDVWSRHILDAAQLFSFRPKGNLRWLDVGSGAGLPGMVLAIVSEADICDHEFILVEANTRRAEFLKMATRQLGVNVDVVALRIEQCAPVGADIITARAVARIDTLVKLFRPHLANRGRAILPKGKSYRREIRLASRHWRFSWQAFPSLTSADGMIVVLKDLAYD